MEDERFLDISLGDGSTLRCGLMANETMGEFALRLKDTTGVTIGISQAVIDGQVFDEDTDVLTYFSAQIPVPELNEGDIPEMIDVEPEILTPDPFEQTAVERRVTNRNEPTKMENLPPVFNGLNLEDILRGVPPSIPVPSVALTGLFCSVSYCGSNKVECPDLAMFSLPQDRERKLEWLTALRRQDEISEDNSLVLNVCANHFLADQFLDKERTTLADTAVPSLFLFEDGNEEPATTDILGMKYWEEKSGRTEGAQASTLAADSKQVTKAVHPGALCRLCAEKLVGCPIYIFDQDGALKGVPEMIATCLPITVSKTDPLPKQICEVCHQRLLLSSSFAKQCMESEEKLTKIAKNFIADRGLCSTHKFRKKDIHTHLCPFCCIGDMEVEATEGNLQLTHDPGHLESGDLLLELYSEDEAEPEQLPTPSDPVQSIDNFVDNPMDLLYLPEDRAFTWSCDICEEMFPTSTACEEHCKLHSIDDYYPCVVCGLVFAEEHLFHNHFSNHRHNEPLVPSDVWKMGRNTVRCGTCQIELKNRKEFMMHPCSNPVILKSFKPERGVHACNSCARVFTTKERAEKHLEEHREEIQYIYCELCGIETVTKKMLEHHMRVMHMTSSVECEECGLRFLGEEHLKRHINVHKAGAVQYKCAQCGQLFVTLMEITGHIQSHYNKDQKEKRKCPKCSLKFNTRAELESHLEQMHSSMERMPSLIQYQCTICGERIKTSAEVLVHRTVHWQGTDPEKPFLCEYCGEPHNSPNSLARHRRYLHPDEQPYVCTVCDKLTRTLYEARVHRKTHTGSADVPPPKPKIYQCDSCPSLFSDRQKFIVHKRSHLNSVMHSCDVCQRRFKGAQQLARHKAVKHNGEKPFVCGHCGKEFTHMSAMYHHARIHTGEAPHECDICGKKYRCKSDRDSHRRKHTGEKPYTCEFCAKTFRTGQVYYQHRMIHTDERRFKCDMCDKSFKRSHTLMCHRRIHTGEKPNLCDICGKGFRQRTDMRKHKINIHNVGDTAKTS